MTNKILVVEDDVDINKALLIRLRAEGYTVFSAQDGLVGVCTATREHPDLMILDISMPGGDGFSIIERMRENPDVPDVPFIFLTASKQPEMRQRACEMGAAAFFEKPYDSVELLAAVRDTLGDPSVTSAWRETI